MRIHRLTDTTISSGILVSVAERILMRLLPVLLLTGFVFCAQGQISFGGMPLEQHAEVHSAIQSAVDCFVEMPAINTDSLLEIDALPGNRIGGLKFAHTFFTNLSPENSGVSFTTEDGTHIWKVGIRSSGAYSLNVLFSEFLLPDGAEVFLYNTDRSCILGAFTNKNRPEGGEFSVAPVEGDELTVEYHEPANAAFKGTIRITEINHDYLGIFRAGTRFNRLNIPCLPDVSCDSTYEEASRSVCLLIINGSTYCTGTLLNNTAGDGRPYLLTASHCLKNNKTLGSRVVAFLNYQSPRCDNRIRGSEEFSVSGSVTRALSNEVDFALLELSELPPADYRPYLSGWSTDTSVTENPYTCLHHPYGEVKKYCIEEDSINTADWIGIDEGISSGNHWHVSKWDTSHTWLGSSGSPLFDKNFRVCGALTCGDSGGSSGCDTVYQGDYFYRFNRAWSQFSDSTKQLKHWLDPLNDTTSSVIRIDGMDPYADNPARRISNILPSDTLGSIMANAPFKGSLLGHNSYGTSYYAEHFTISDSSMIQGVYLMAVKGTNNSLLPITIRVYQGGSEPGNVLTKVVLNPDYTDYSSGSFIQVSKSSFSNAENYVRFEKPISVGVDFYIGYQISYPITETEDTFYLYSAIRNNATYNTAFYSSNLKWNPFSSHFEKPVYTSIWIEPIVLNDTITNSYDTIIDDDTTYLSEPVLVYAEQESLVYLSFPANWTEKTSIDIFDLSGVRIMTTQVMPPTPTFTFKPKKHHLYLFRLTSQKKQCILKLVTF